MNHYATIRAALELADSYMAGTLREEREKYAGRESISNAESIASDIEENKVALAALAELERAAGEPALNRHSWVMVPVTPTDEMINAARADAEIAELRRDAERMRLLDELWVSKLASGEVSEGQASKATLLPRVELRRRADEIDAAEDAARGGE